MVVVLRFPALIALAFTSILRFHKMIEFVILNALIALKVTGVGKDLWRKVCACVVCVCAPCMRGMLR